jgi:VWFA-related protein
MSPEPTTASAAAVLAAFFLGGASGASIPGYHSHSPGQVAQHDVRVVSVRIPVRVFLDGRSVPGLEREDFELYESGRVQEIASVHEFREALYIRQEQRELPDKAIQRTFVLIFDLRRPADTLEEALRAFSERALSEDDSLIVMTPEKTYRLKEAAAAGLPRESVSEQLVRVVRRDLQSGARAYTEALRNSAEILLSTDGAHGSRIASDLLASRAFRTLDPKKLEGLIAFLSGRPGEKHIILFLERELVPRLSAGHPDAAAGLEADEEADFEALDNLNPFKRDLRYDPASLRMKLARASATLYFFYLTALPPVDLETTEIKPRGVKFEEESANTFDTFARLAQESGGEIESSANMAALMSRATKALENYYILEYSPHPYVSDGRFHEVAVRVKRPGCRVIHRPGYVAD